MSDGADAVLDVKDLSTVFETGQGRIHAVNPVSSCLRPDEPAAAPDVSIRTGVVSLLEHLRERFGPADLLISNDLSAAATLPAGPGRKHVILTGDAMKPTKMTGEPTAGESMNS